MDILKKIGGGLIALVLIAVLAPTVASGLTVEELQAQIAALQAQLAELLAQLAQLEGQAPAAGLPAACTGITFERNLTVGMTGNDVKCLQALLNTDPDTKVAETGAGSPGNETSYFGPLTKAAVIKFQEKYKDEVLTPIGLTAGTGFVGPKTRAKLNALLAAGVPELPTEEKEEVPAAAPGLTVALAPDTPAAGTVITGQALAELARYTFTNGDQQEVKVTKVVLTRTGISADNTLSAVFLYEGVNRLTDLAAVSAGKITFVNSAGVFKLSPGQSKTISVKANIATSTAGQTVGVKISAATDIESNASAVNGNFPLAGNLMSVATANLAKVLVSTTGISQTTNIQPGTKDFTVWRNSLNIQIRPVKLNSLSLRQIGSIRVDDLRNFRLFVRGLETGSPVAQLAEDNTLTFDLSASPVELPTGPADIEVRADVISGSNRTFSFALWRASDLNVTDSEFGVNVMPTGTTFPVAAPTSGTNTIGAGNLTVVKAADSPVGPVVINGTDVVLAKYTLTAYGEKVKVERLTVDLQGANNSGYTPADVTLRNGRLLANGVQVGSTLGLAGDGTTYELGSSLIVEPGSPVTLEVRADIFDEEQTNDIDANDTITARLVTGSNNGQTLESLTLRNVPSANVDGNARSVASGQLVLAKNDAFGDQSAVAGTAGVKIGSFVLQVGSAEAVRISNYQVGITVDEANVVLGELSNLKISESTEVKGSVFATNNFSVNQVLDPNTSKVIDVFLDISSAAALPNIEGTIVPSLALTARGVTSGNVVSVSAVTGQTTTIQTGSLAVALDTGTPTSTIVLGGSTEPVAKYRFTAQNESFTVNEVKIKVTDSADYNAVTTLRIGTLSAPLVNGEATFAGNLLIVPKDDSAVLTVEATFNTIGSGAGDSGDTPTFRLTSYKAVSASGLVFEQSGLVFDSNEMVLRKTKPTVTLNSATLSNALGGIDHEVLVINVAAASTEDVVIREIRVTPTITGSVTGGNGIAVYEGTTERGRVMNQSTSGNVTATTAGVITVGTTEIGKYQVGEKVNLTLVRNDTGTCDATETVSGTTITAVDTNAGTFTVSPTPDNNDNANCAGDAITPAGYTTGNTYRIPLTNAIVPAGTSKTFTVKADTTGLTSSGDSIQVRILADTSVGPDGNLIWREGTAGADINGYLVKELPITGPALIRP